MKTLSFSRLTRLPLTLLLLTISLSSTASECKVSPKVLSAYYDFTQQLSNNQVVKNTPTQLFELHRYNNRVLQRDINQGVDDIWSNKGKRLSLNRAFEQYQHIIEYQSNELRYQPKWQDIFQLVSTPDLNKMQLVGQKNSGCQFEEHYVLTTKKTEYQLVWLPRLKLVKFFELKSSTITKQWALTDYQDDAEQIASLFNEYSSYQSTDYADVGDNESTPFLAAMINQGFSATQNAHGIHTHQEGH